VSQDWVLPHAHKDAQSVTSDWQSVRQTLIDGVAVRESRAVAKRNGSVTEVFRDDWFEAGATAGQVFMVRLAAAGISAWHAHAITIDRIAVVAGAATLVLFDGRTGSPTVGLINEFHLHDLRPTLVVIPPQVWHGVINSGDQMCLLANVPDRPYRYDDPDHWRVDSDSPDVPYRFDRGRGRAF
jgi:dTDP-4-dehydrorhamnose 3,5-epimerase